MLYSPIISIIVPVYNTEKYLSKCIESILQQTFCEFELLLIDDGSTDLSGDICDNFTSLDERIIVVHKQNEGVSVARNLGIEKARGEWVCFVDSDDYVDSGYLLGLYSAIESNTDLVVEGYIEVDEQERVLHKEFYESRVYDNFMFGSMLVEQPLYYRGAPWAKLFRRKNIIDNNIFFHPNIKFGEDLCFLFDYLYVINLVSFLDVSNYFYVQREGSATHKIFKFDVEYSGYKYLKRTMLSFIKEYGTKEYEFNEYFSWISLFLYRSIIAVENSVDFTRIANEDWNFFIKYYVPKTKKQRIDKVIICFLYRNPFCVLYLLFRKSLFAFVKKYF
ncbi:glycosyltransferase family 2 protein [Bacteroides cellulosilyticus]|jgi:hypothetical protein|uniref:glycosyltransferase family 2 protein n=1 Tax=Bacteroides cellulosilyticus TaxID=246787 RepID=UPI0032BF8B77